MFSLISSTIRPALRWRKTFVLLRVIRTSLAIVSVLLLLLLTITSDRNILIGIILVFLALASNLKILDLFFNHSLCKPKIRISLDTALNNSEHNLASLLTFEAGVIIKKAVTRTTLGKRPLSSNLIFRSLKNKKIKFILYRTGIASKNFKKLSPKSTAPEPTIEEIIIRAGQIALQKQHARIEITDVFASLSYISPLFLAILFDKDLDKDDISDVSYWVDRVFTARKRQQEFWNNRNLGLGGGLGKNLSTGWTYHLDQYVYDLLSEVKNNRRTPYLASHQPAMDMLQQTISGNRQNNVLLVGEDGVGKKNLVYNLAKQILDGQTLPNLRNHRLLSLDTESIAGLMEKEGAEKLRKILKEASSAGNVILFIEQIHRILGLDNKNNTGSDLSAILTPYLEGTELKLIGATNYSQYHSKIEKRGDLLKIFEKVEVNAPLPSESVVILEDIVPSLESQYKTIVTYPILKKVVDLSDRYINDKPFPEKAIDILEEAMVSLSKTDRNVLSKEDVENIISSKTEIPVGKASASEKEKLLNLEEIIHQQVVNQKTAIKVISDALRRNRAGVTNTKKPIGTFLFVGSTGVGKTETAKALSNVYFGKKHPMIRLDMSEYQNIEDLEKFLGSADGQIEGQLTSRIREDPFALILLDEIEKANKKILNLFLQVLDEGRLTDGRGQTVSFLSTIIIATSNAGSEFIRQRTANGSVPDGFDKQLLDHIQEAGIFAPEFLNRFDAVVTFQPLSVDNIQKIARLMLNQLITRVNEKNDIELSLDESAIQKIAQLGYEPAFGARPMRRVIQDRVESKIANKILSEEIQRGDKIQLTAEDI